MKGNENKVSATELERLKRMPYEMYLLTDHWFRVRQAALKRAGHRCQICNAKGILPGMPKGMGGARLEVHHRTYERKGHERPMDVIVLCNGCHRIFHRAKKLVRE